MIYKLQQNVHKLKTDLSEVKLKYKASQLQVESLHEVIRLKDMQIHQVLKEAAVYKEHEKHYQTSSCQVLSCRETKDYSDMDITKIYQNIEPNSKDSSQMDNQVFGMLDQISNGPGCDYS